MGYTETVSGNKSKDQTEHIRLATIDCYICTKRIFKDEKCLDTFTKEDEYTHFYFRWFHADVDMADCS